MNCTVNQTYYFPALSEAFSSRGMFYSRSLMLLRINSELAFRARKSP